jgi:hypothetical protein
MGAALHGCSGLSRLESLSRGLEVDYVVTSSRVATGIVPLPVQLGRPI